MTGASSGIVSNWPWMAAAHFLARSVSCAIVVLHAAARDEDAHDRRPCSGNRRPYRRAGKMPRFRPRRGTSRSTCRTSLISPLSSICQMPEAGALVIISVLSCGYLRMSWLQLSNSAQRFCTAQVDLPIRIHEFEQVEEVDGAAAIGRGDEVGHRARARDARIDLAQIDFASIGIDEEVHAEGAAIAMRIELVAELLRHARAPPCVPSPCRR